MEVEVQTPEQDGASGMEEWGSQGQAACFPLPFFISSFLFLGDVE